MFCAFKFFRSTKTNKVISILLAQLFLFWSVAFASVDKTVPLAENNDLIQEISTENIAIPKDFGSIKDKYKGHSQKLIIHIQDAHCNYEAQTNIAGILEELIRRYNVDFVVTEGADGVVDTSWFRAFPDAEIRKQVADYFMKKGEITGVEFLSITSDYPFTIYGAENRSHYIKNLNAFLESYPYRTDIQEYYTDIKEVLYKIKKYIYTKELLELDHNIDAHREKEIEFSEYARFLQSMADSNKVDIKKYFNFRILTETLKLEKDIDFDIVNEERAELIDELSNTLAKNKLANLVNKSLSFKLGKIDNNDFYTFLNDTARENNISLSEKYSNLARYIIYVRIYSRIDNEKLFDEIDHIVMDLKDTLISNGEQRTLDKLWTNVNIILGFTDIELTNKEYDYYVLNKKEFTPKEFTGFIAKMSSRFGFSYDIATPPVELDSIFLKLVDFYEIATKRDKILVDNMFKGMQNYKTDVAVLVTGGFHTKGITDLLAKKDVSYIIVSPTITKEEESPYISVLTGQKTPFEELLTESKNEQLAPASKFSPLGRKDEITGRTEDMAYTFLDEMAVNMIRAYVMAYPDKTKEGIKSVLIDTFKANAENCVDREGSQYILRQITDRFEEVYASLTSGKQIGEISRAEAYSSPIAFQAYVTSRIRDLIKAIPELESLMKEYNQLPKGDKRDKLAKEIDRLIKERYNAKLVEGIVGSLDNLTDENVVSEIPNLKAFRDSSNYERYMELAREIIFSHKRGRIDVYAGAASRLFGEGQDADVALSYFAHDVYSVATSRGVEIPQDIRKGISMGTRLAIQEWIDIEEQLRNLYASKGIEKTPQEIILERKKIISQTPRVIMINSESGLSIIKEIVDNNFYGYNPELTVFVVQSTYKGYNVENGRPELIEATRPIPAGHGDATMQIVQPGRAFWVDNKGQMHHLSENAIEYLTRKTGAKVYVQSRVNDMIKLGTEKDTSLDTSEIDLEIFALALSQMGSLDELSGKNAVLEQVGQDPKNPIKGGSPLNLKGTEFLVEGLAQTPLVAQLVGREGVPFNRFYIFYKALALTRILKEKGLPIYFRFRDGYIYPETVTGDMTMLPGMNAGWALEWKRQINDYKDGVKTINNGIEAAYNQDQDPVFVEYEKQLRGEKRDIDLKGIGNAPGLVETEKEGDAITLTGQALTPEQHKRVNEIIKDAFNSGSATRVKTVDGVDVYLIPGLAECDDFLIAHAGRGGEAMSHSKQQVYISPKRYNWIDKLPVDAQEQFWSHETAHPKNPGLSEKEIQGRYPIDKVLAEVQKNEMQEFNVRPLVNDIETVTLVEDVPYDETGQPYKRPLLKFAKFGTSGVRWLIPGAFDLLRKYTQKYTVLESHGYKQEDFNRPNVSILAKAVALYNIEKRRGQQPIIKGTQEEFNKRLDEKGILVIYDNRPGSEQRAKDVAKVLLAYGIKPTLAYRDGKAIATPTPAASLIIDKLGYAGAIILTASHNGDEWNGLKFNAEDGAPAAPSITDAIGKIMHHEFYETETPTYMTASQSVEDLLKVGKIGAINTAEFYVQQVIDYIGKDRFEKIKEALQSGRVVFNFSAYFGSSGPVAEALFEALGLRAKDVLEVQKGRKQAYIESYEPTLKRLTKLQEEVLSSAEKGVISIGSAADNDADRFNVNEAVISPDGRKTVKEFTPGEIAGMLYAYLSQTRGWRGPAGRSFVSSEYVDEIAKMYGQSSIEEPTGFKFAPSTFNKGALLHYEESYGISFKDWTFDKDGILPGILALELVAMTGKSLSEYNEMIKSELEKRDLRKNFYFERHDMLLTELQKERALELIDAFYKDITIGKTTFAEQRVAGVYDAKKYGGIKFVLEDGSWIAVRSSGTEPVIRIYIETVNARQEELLYQEACKLLELNTVALQRQVVDRIKRAEKEAPKEEIILATSGNSKAVYVGPIDGYVIEKYVLSIGDILPVDPIAIRGYHKIYVKEGKVTLRDVKTGRESVTLSTDEMLRTKGNDYELHYGGEYAILYIEYSPEDAESMVLSGFEALNSPETKTRFSQMIKNERKPIMLHVPSTMHAGNSFINEKRALRSISGGTVTMAQYGREIDSLKEEKLDPTYTHVFVAYSDDLERARTDKDFADSLKDILTQKIMPIARPKVESKGVAFVREIESAATILGMTDKSEIEQGIGSAVSLQRIISQLVGGETEVTFDLLRSLMGVSSYDFNQIATRISILINKLLIARPIDKYDMDSAINARREILWSL